jgi:hypothetical protein
VLIGRLGLDKRLARCAGTRGSVSFTSSDLGVTAKCASSWSWGGTFPAISTLAAEAAAATIGVTVGNFPIAGVGYRLRIHLWKYLKLWYTRCLLWKNMSKKQDTRPARRRTPAFFFADGFEFLHGAEPQFTDFKNAKGITIKKLGQPLPKRSLEMRMKLGPP